MRLRSLLLAVALGAGLTVLPAPSASAIGCSSGNCLVVIAYYSDQRGGTLVGQKWWGCGTSGSWGVTTGISELHTPDC
jgi:hypothetical protein